MGWWKVCKVKGESSPQERWREKGAWQAHDEPITMRCPPPWALQHRFAPFFNLAWKEIFIENSALAELKCPPHRVLGLRCSPVQQPQEKGCFFSYSKSNRRTFMPARLGIDNKRNPGLASKNIIPWTAKAHLHGQLKLPIKAHPDNCAPTATIEIIDETAFRRSTSVSNH